MKSYSTILAFTALAAAVPMPDAAAPPTHYPVNWCQVPGAPCHKARGLEAGFTPGTWSPSSTPRLQAFKPSNATFTTVGDPVGACGVPGQPCDMVKRAAFAINDILARFADANPLPCAPGTFCAHKRHELGQIADAAINGYDTVVAREAEAEAAAGSQIPASSTSSFQKRDRQATELNIPDSLIHFCGKSLCARQSTDSPERVSHIKRCAGCLPGHCSATQLAICADNHFLDDPAAAIPGGTNQPVPGAGQIFGPCAEVPGAVLCELKKRDVTAEDKALLAQPRGVADTLRDIKRAVAAVKREALELRQKPADFGDCEKGRCSPVTSAHILAQRENKDEADVAEAFSWGPYGASANTIGAFNAIERRVDTAVESLF